MKSDVIWYEDGQDISQECMKCGSTDVHFKSEINVEWAPKWATYAGSVGLMSIYRRLCKKVTIRVGYCKKHTSKPWLRKAIGYSTLLISIILIFLGVDLQKGILSTIGILGLFAFLFIVSGSSPVKAREIKDGRVLLLKPIPR